MPYFKKSDKRSEFALANSLVTELSRSMWLQPCLVVMQLERTQWEGMLPLPAIMPCGTVTKTCAWA